MSSWTSGYVADLGYTHGFYRELTPNILAFAMLAKGLRHGSGAERPSYCELGCGQGVSANLLAAANPGIDFYAADFNPAHIVGARELAAAAGTSNVHFFDQSFTEFDSREDLPRFDVIALHGIYSWVAEEHRRTLRGFIDKRLKPGGLVYVSYNALPGWAAMAPLRQLIAMHGRQTGGPTAGRLDPALAFVERMAGARARFFTSQAGFRERFDKVKAQQRNYLAHEYLNDAWTLFYHADVAAEMAEARLSFAGSAHLLDHVDSLNLSDEQQKILAEAVDPAFRETLRDYMVNQQFRRDIFVRGTIAMSQAEVQDRWRDWGFVLTVPREDVSMKVSGAQGEGNLQPEVYAPLLDLLAAGEGRAVAMDDLAGSAHGRKLGFARLVQALVILVGGGSLQPVPLSAGDGGRAKAPAQAFNRAVTARARYSAEIQFLAVPASGGGMALDRIQQLFLLAAAQDEADPARFAWAALSRDGQRILKDGKMLETPEENIAELGRRHATFVGGRLPLMRGLGVAP